MTSLITTFSILLPLSLNLIITQVILYIAHKNKLYDFTDERKTHAGNIPRLGGIGFFMASMVSTVIIYIILKEHISTAFYIAAILVFTSGVVDDFKPVAPIIKLLTQVTASLALIIGGHVFDYIYIPFLSINLSLGYIGYIITFLWIIGVTNAVNLLDGMDGQAGGVSLFASLTIGIISIIIKNYNIAIMCFILSGALIGFLRYNLPPAKIFMGDSGSLTLGFFLSALPLLYKNNEIKGQMILVSIAVLLIPIFDVFAAMIRRKKRGQSFLEPDRGHIHHKFTDFTSLSTKQILLVVYTLSIISGAIAVLFILFNNLITQGLLFINVIIHISVFSFLHYRKSKKEGA